MCARLLVSILLSSPRRLLSRRDESRSVFAEIDRTARELADISALKLHKHVASDLISKDKVNAFLKKKVKEVSTPEEMRAEELTLKKFGLVPQDFDLAKTTVDVLTEQAAAFYDYHAKKLYITDWTPSATREAALAHELAHALADQNFNLKRFIRKAHESDDEALARMAVMEGQATWLMSEFMARRMGESLVHHPELAEQMNRLSDSGAGGEFPVFEGAPLYIRATLIFPYTRWHAFPASRGGQARQGGVCRDLPARSGVHTAGAASRKVFRGGEALIAGSAQAPPNRRGYKGLIGGTFGELDHQILLEHFTGQADGRRNCSALARRSI